MQRRLVSGCSSETAEGTSGEPGTCLMKEPECEPEAREGAEGHGGGLGQSSSCNGSVEEAGVALLPLPSFLFGKELGMFGEEDEEGW